MKRFIPLAILAMGLAGSASAQRVTPACSTLALFSDFLSAGQCTLGDSFVLKNPGYSTEGGIAADEVNFSASYLAGVISVGLSGQFQTALGETDTYTIKFLVDPPPEIIIGYDSDVDWGSTTNSLVTQAGSGSLTGSLCAGAAFSGLASPTTCSANFRGFLSNPATPQNGMTFPATNIVDVNLFIRLQDGGQMNSVSAVTRSTLTSAIPEPALGIAAGAVFLGLIAARRRRA